VLSVNVVRISDSHVLSQVRHIPPQVDPPLAVLAVAVEAYHPGNHNLFGLGMHSRGKNNAIRPIHSIMSDICVFASYDFHFAWRNIKETISEPLLLHQNNELSKHQRLTVTRNRTNRKRRRVCRVAKARLPRELHKLWIHQRLLQPPSLLKLFFDGL
jgi:hypothetical protein